jgi:class 3 adenylate cyclase/tetratricopeptide (TPR) repeat protein
MSICAACGQDSPEGFKFCGSCGASLEAPALAREERKVVTVLFADLVGFTSRAERMDPEDVRALLAPYHAHLRSELERYGGTVEKFIGDAVMALFGAPVAHEDDPERAVRAALAIRDWMREQEEELQLRIAVNTGEALISLGARPEAGEGMASGDVVNTTARLQAAAPVNGILVGESTYRATREMIDYRKAGPVEAKGKAEPVQVWEAVEARSRFGTGVVEAPGTPLVGRERELRLLSEALARVREERAPQLVTLVGVPGIGKSRLVYELFDEIGRGTELTYWRQGRSLPYGDGVSFWALSEMIKAQAGVLETDSSDEVARKLAVAVESLVGDAPDADWIVEHLRPLAGLGVESELSGDRRSEAFAAWRQFFEAMSEQHPLVLVFEDLHWADDGLLDFVDHLIEWSGDLPILVVCTARPELLDRRPGWGGGKLNATTISLSPLSDDETAWLLATLLEQPLLEAGAQQTLLAHAGGNPLYAEQYAQMLEETKGTGELALPETVQGIIAARLDLLSSAEKELIQDASVLGKVFWLGGLLDGRARSESEERLHALERKGFVQRARRSSVADEMEYTFRHLLVRDVAYGQIPRAARAEKHRRAAEWIGSLGRPADHGEMLAHHYVSALEFARAAGQATDELATAARLALREAGDRALALSAFASAERFYAEALALWPKDDSERPRLLLSLGKAQRRLERGEDALTEALEGLLALGDREGAAETELLLSNLRWYEGNRDEAYAHIARAESLVEGASSFPTRARVLSELSRYHMLGGRDQEAIAVGRQALAMAEELGLDVIRAHALNNIGAARSNMGDREGLEDLERSIEISTAANSPELIRGYTNLAAMYGRWGDLDRVHATQDEGIRLGERFGATDQLYWLKSQRGLFSTYTVGRWDESLANAEQLIAGDRHYTQRSAYGVRAEIRLARGDVTGAVADTECAVELGRTAKDPQAIVPSLAVAAFASVGAGDLSKAAEYAEEILAGDSGFFDFGPTLYYLAWVLTALERADELAKALTRVPRASPWREASLAIGSGELSRAAEIYSGAGSHAQEAYTHLRAAEAEDAGAQLDKAIAFFRQAGATAYLARAERLVSAAASG